MSEPYLGTIQTYGFNFAPRGWTLCDGQLLPIASYQALFSLFGTTYGGDGRTTFGLPDLRSRNPVGVGQGPGLDNISWGERGGRYEITLQAQNIAPHTHPLHGTNTLGDQRTPNSNALAGDGSGDATYKSSATLDGTLQSGSVGNNAGGIPFNSRNPFLGIYYSVALTGLFPSRN